MLRTRLVCWSFFYDRLKLDISSDSIKDSVFWSFIVGVLHKHCSFCFLISWYNLMWADLECILMYLLYSPVSHSRKYFSDVVSLTDTFRTLTEKWQMSECRRSNGATQSLILTLSRLKRLYEPRSPTLLLFTLTPFTSH